MARSLPTFLITKFDEAVEALYRIRDEVNRVLRRMDHSGFIVLDDNQSPGVYVVPADPRSSPGFRANVGSLACVFGTATWYKKTTTADTGWTLTTI